MSALQRLASLFRPLDTTEVDRSLDRLEQSTRGVAVRARALRMDVSCGDFCETANRVRRFTGTITRVAGETLRQIYSAPLQEPVPEDMNELLRKLD